MNCLVSELKKKERKAYVCQLILFLEWLCVVLFPRNIPNEPSSLIGPFCHTIWPCFLSNKIDETISLGNLQELKLAFEVLYKLHILNTHCQSGDSFLWVLTGFSLVKELEMGGLTSIDANNFGHIVKKCLGLPKTVRKCDISLYILLSLSDSLISVFSLSHIFKIEDKPLQVQYLINSQYVSLFFIMLCIEFHRAMSKFKGYLRKLIIPAKEGFHGWDDDYLYLFLMVHAALLFWRVASFMILLMH